DKNFFVYSHSLQNYYLQSCSCLIPFSSINESKYFPLLISCSNRSRSLEGGLSNSLIPSFECILNVGAFASPPADVGTLVRLCVSKSVTSSTCRCCIPADLAESKAHLDMCSFESK